MLKKVTAGGKVSGVGVQRRATISQADERLAEITNTTAASQTPAQELKRYFTSAVMMSLWCLSSDMMLDCFWRSCRS